MEALHQNIRRGELSNWVSFYLNRVVTFQPARAWITAAIRGYIRWRCGSDMPIPGAGSNAAVATLAADGYVELGTLLSSQECSEIADYLSDKSWQDRDRASPPFRLSEAPENARLADLSLADAIKCPHVLNLANSPLLLGIASQYLGCKPTLSSLVIRWSAPKGKSESDLQRFHRDTDDWRFFKVMLYLTDVDEGCGPHIFVKSSHLERQSLRQRFWRDDEIITMCGMERLAVALGPRGTAFAVNTVGVHKGQAPQQRTRLILMLQYSMLPCYHASKEPLRACMPAGIDPYINRRLFAEPEEPVAAPPATRRVVRT